MGCKKGGVFLLLVEFMLYQIFQEGEWGKRRDMEGGYQRSMPPQLYSTLYSVYETTGEKERGRMEVQAYKPCAHALTQSAANRVTSLVRLRSKQSRSLQNMALLRGRGEGNEVDS